MSRLILTRKAKETIVANGPIRITVVRIDGNRVKLACEAGKMTTIVRGELLERRERDHADA
jgi:carbon storage regulator CsrA